MAILDILNRVESEFCAKAFKLEVDYFNRDLGLLFNNKANVVQPSYDYLLKDKIFPNLQKTFIKVTSLWEGRVTGEPFIVIKVQDAKVMCGLLMMMGADDIKETLVSEFSADDQEIFKEIANQINGSLDNALRENFKFDFHSTLKSVEVVSIEGGKAEFEALFPEQGYMSVVSILKLNGFPDSFIQQYIPREVIKNICTAQNLDDTGASGAGGASSDKDKALLIVDDDPVVRKIIKGFLKDLDWPLLEANDGVEAMQTLIRANVGLIVLDIEMPNMNGFETCKRVKQNPKTRNIPVIMCSSKSTRENVLEAVNCGARDFVVKPINQKDAFQERIQKYFK